MSFDEKYKLLELADDESAKTFTALDLSTRKKVTVFLFPGEHARRQADFLDKLRSAGPAFPELIEMGDNQGTPYVVTEPIRNLLELKERLRLWLQAESRTSTLRKPDEFAKVGIWRVPPALQSVPKQAEEPSVQARQPQVKETAASEEGIFADMFRAPAPPIGEPPLQAPKTPPAVSPQTHTTLGEITEFIQVAAPPIPEAAPEIPKDPASAQVFQAEPGEFTRMFQAAAPPIGEEAPEIPKAPATLPVWQPEPGEFTRFFEAAGAAVRTPQKPQAEEPKGEFTRLFGPCDIGPTLPSSGTQILGRAAVPQSSADDSAAPLKDRGYDSPPGEFTRVFGDSSPETPPSGAAASQPTAVPGEYTRIFGYQSPPQETPREPMPASIQTSQKQAPQKEIPYLVPVLIGVILLLLALIVVLLVTMRT